MNRLRETLHRAVDRIVDHVEQDPENEETFGIDFSEPSPDNANIRTLEIRRFKRSDCRE